VPLDPARAVAELRELHALTGDEHGAQRVCWTEPWAKARDWLRGKLAELPVKVEVDEAGNLWATLAGAPERAVLVRRAHRLRLERRPARRLPQRPRRARGTPPRRAGERDGPPRLHAGLTAESTVSKFGFP